MIKSTSKILITGKTRRVLVGAGLAFSAKGESRTWGAGNGITTAEWCGQFPASVFALTAHKSDGSRQETLDSAKDSRYYNKAKTAHC